MSNAHPTGSTPRRLAADAVYCLQQVSTSVDGEAGKTRFGALLWVA